MYKPRKPNDVPYFTTEIVATSSSSSSPTKKPSGSAAKKHVASCKPGFQPSAAAHPMAVSTSFRVIPRIWYCGVVVVISRKSEYGSSSASAVSTHRRSGAPISHIHGDLINDVVESEAWHTGDLCFQPETDATCGSKQKGPRMAGLQERRNDLVGFRHDSRLRSL